MKIEIERLPEGVKITVVNNLGENESRTFKLDEIRTLIQLLGMAVEVKSFRFVFEKEETTPKKRKVK